MNPNRNMKWLLLLVAISVTSSSCGTAYRSAEKAAVTFANSGLWHFGRHGRLTEQEKRWAEIAWTYFENNYNAETGFVNSIDRYQVVSIWHVADFIAALYCARRLSLIDQKTFDEQFSKLIHQLNTMPLAFGQLPNILYNTKTGEMVNYANQQEEVGWSVVDIGRLLLWLNVIKSNAPEFSEYIDRVILRFSYCEVIGEDGELYSARKENNKLIPHRENAIGYADYAQIGFRLWGLSTPPKYRWAPDHKVTIYDIEFEYDSNWARREGVYGPILSMPYLLAGIELHWKMPSNYGAKQADGDYLQKYSEKIYKVQEKRYEYEGISTARTDHNLNRPPFFLQDSIFGDGFPWSSLSDTGEHFPHLALVSTRAAFGLWALWRTQYTDHLMDVIDELYDKNRGWYEGRYESTSDYERTISISTNTAVLEALTYKVYGPLFKMPEQNTYAITRLSDQFKHPNGCLPKLGTK